MRFILVRLQNLTWRALFFHVFIFALAQVRKIAKIQSCFSGGGGVLKVLTANLRDLSLFDDPTFIMQGELKVEGDMDR